MAKGNGQISTRGVSRDSISILGFPRVQSGTRRAEVLCRVRPENVKYLFEVRLDRDPKTGVLSQGIAGLIDQVRAQLSTLRAEAAAVGTKNLRATEEGHQVQTRIRAARESRVRQEFTRLHATTGMNYPEILKTIKVDWAKAVAQRKTARRDAVRQGAASPTLARVEAHCDLLDEIDPLGLTPLSDTTLRRYTKDLQF